MFEKQIVKSNTIQAHYALHTNNVNVKCQFVINETINTHIQNVCQ